MRTFLALLLMAVLGAGLGFLLTPAPRAPEVVAPVSRLNVPVFDRDGLQLSMAVGAFDALGLLAPAQTSTTEAAPPQIDIAENFRRDLTAIVRSQGRTVVWVVNHETGERRGLRRGGIYADGWRIAAINAQEVLLRREGEERRVSLFGAPRAGPT